MFSRKLKSWLQVSKRSVNHHLRRRHQPPLQRHLVLHLRHPLRCLRPRHLHHPCPRPLLRLPRHQGQPHRLLHLLQCLLQAAIMPGERSWGLLVHFRKGNSKRQLLWTRVSPEYDRLTRLSIKFIFSSPSPNHLVQIPSSNPNQKTNRKRGSIRTGANNKISWAG